MLRMHRLQMKLKQILHNQGGVMFPVEDKEHSRREGCLELREQSLCVKLRDIWNGLDRKGEGCYTRGRRGRGGCVCCKLIYCCCLIREYGIAARVLVGGGEASFRSCSLGGFEQETVSMVNLSHLL